MLGSGLGAGVGAGARGWGWGWLTLDGYVDVAVERDELDRLLQAPHAALHALHAQLEHHVLVLRVLVRG